MAPLTARNHDLHGSAPDTFHTVLLLIDVINDMEFEGGEALFEHAFPAAKRIRELKKQAKKGGIPAVYVNDNYGRWQSDFHQIVNQCLRQESTGKPIAELLKPEDDDYFVIKPKHSGFFSTTLDTLLAYLEAERLILAGFQTDICVLFTANEAFMRDYHLYVPSDCSASEEVENHNHALKQMERLLLADTTPSTDLDIDQLIRMNDSRSSSRPHQQT